MAKVLGKEEREYRLGVKRLLENCVKKTQRRHEYLEIGFGLGGIWYVLYIFGRKMSGRERRNAIKECTRIICENSIDIYAFRSTSKYPLDAGSAKNNEILYLPQRIVRCMEDGKGIGLQVLGNTLNVDPRALQEALTQLHEFGIIRVSPLGHVWFKDDLKALVPNIITPPHIHPKDIRIMQ